MSDIRIVKEKIPISELQKLAEEIFGEFVKAVVDLQKRVMAVGGELHADAEAVLLDHGSRQEDLWGINIYPARSRDAWIEFDSMINIRPRQGNRSRTIEDASIRTQIAEIIASLVSQ